MKKKVITKKSKAAVKPIMRHLLRRSDARSRNLNDNLFFFVFFSFSIRSFRYREKSESGPQTEKKNEKKKKEKDWFVWLSSNKLYDLAACTTRHEQLVSFGFISLMRPEKPPCAWWYFMHACAL